jgi:LPS-assembly lipoprotein
VISHVRIALVIVLTALTLSACSGWQLRGQTSTPELESITLDGASARLRYTLEDELEPSGVLIHGQSQNIVMILDERWDSRTAAVDARGRATIFTRTWPTG